MRSGARHQIRGDPGTGRSGDQGPGRSRDRGDRGTGRSGDGRSGDRHQIRDRTIRGRSGDRHQIRDRTIRGDDPGTGMRSAGHEIRRRSGDGAGTRSGPLRGQASGRHWGLGGARRSGDRHRSQRSGARHEIRAPGTGMRSALRGQASDPGIDPGERSGDGAIRGRSDPGTGIAQRRGHWHRARTGVWAVPAIARSRLTRLKNSSRSAG